MCFLRLIAIGLVSIVLAQSAGVADSLPRRGYLGMRVYPLDSANATRLGLVDTTGIWVQMLSGISPAAAVGVHVDDVIHAIDGEPTPGIGEFAVIMAPRLEGDRIHLSLTRFGTPLEIDVTLTGRPLESLPGLEFIYDSFAVGDGVRLRSILCRPEGREDETIPAVLILQPHVAGSVERGGYNIYRELALRFAERGIAVMRYDRRGIGDSEGPPFHDMDLEAEIADAERALEQLKSQPGIDSLRVFLLGDGTGALHAARLASQRADIRGLVLHAAPGRDWPEYATASVRTQAEFGGADSTQISVIQTALESFFSELTQGGSVDEILDRNPERHGIVVSTISWMIDRGDTYLNQLAAMDVADLYGALECPVLAVKGSADFATPPESIRLLDDLLTASGVEHGVIELSGTDGHFAHAESPEASLRDAALRDLVFNEDAIDPIVEWMRLQMLHR